MEEQEKEIHDMLIEAGYYRINIPKIDKFDKILGALAWCIQCSNFEIEIFFQDDMKIGQKIKLAEKIEAALKKMNVKAKISVVEITKVMYPKLLPLFKELIEFVKETKESRQDFNQGMSKLITNKLYQEAQDIEVYHQELMKEKKKKWVFRDLRESKNSKIKELSFQDPLRVYSALIEYGDMMAYKAYNTLQQIANKKIDIDIKDKKSNERVSNLLFFNQENETQIKQTKKLDSNSREIENTKFTIDNEYDNFKDKKSEINNKKIDKLFKNVQNIELEVKDEENDEMQQKIQAEKDYHKKQMVNLKKKNENYEQKLQEISEQLFILKDEQQVVDDNMNEQKLAKDTIQQEIDDIQKTLDPVMVKKTEEILIQKVQLEKKKKERKKEIKKLAKELQIESENIEKEAPKVDQTKLEELQQKYKSSKKTYDKYYKDYTKINQEIACLQRKIQQQPSAPEVAQYTQRFHELWNAIHIEQQKSKDISSQFNQKLTIKQVLGNFTKIYETFKENFHHTKKDNKAKKVFKAELEKTYVWLKNNMNETSELVDKQSQQVKLQKTQLTNLEQLERDYNKILKDFNAESDINYNLMDELQKWQENQ